MSIPSAWPVYRIVRFYKADNRHSRTTQSGLTLAEAQAHCQDAKTRKDGVYFDGYDLMPAYAKKYGKDA